MAHEIEELDGAAYALKPAWHGLGAVLDHLMTADEALEAAQLGWEVGLEPMHDRFGAVVDGPRGSWRWTVRKDLPETDVRRYLGRLTSDYTVVQNRELFSYCEALCGESGAKFESALSMRNGRLVAVVLNAGESMAVKDDVIEQYFVATTSHDGSRQLDLLFTPIRVVCSNTLSMALEGAKNRATLMHVGDVSKRALVAAECLKEGRAYFDRQQGVLTELAEAQVDAAFERAYLEVLFPAGDTPRAQTAADKQRSAVADLFHGGQAGAFQVACHGTAYGLYNAVVEYVDHGIARQGGRTEESRAESLLLQGNGLQARKQQAFDVLQRGLTVRDRVAVAA
jgi:phage/plasmid-like protein (TIGR03299 family)